MLCEVTGNSAGRAVPGYHRQSRACSRCTAHRRLRRRRVATGIHPPRNLVEGAFTGWSRFLRVRAPPGFAVGFMAFRISAFLLRRACQPETDRAGRDTPNLFRRKGGRDAARACCAAATTLHRHIPVPDVSRDNHTPSPRSPRVPLDFGPSSRERSPGRGDDSIGGVLSAWAWNLS